MGNSRSNLTESQAADILLAALVARLGNVETIGNYKYSILDRIGAGGFGIVFKGCHKDRSELVVAIKRIGLRNIRNDANIVFEREIKILKELHHQNIVQLFDCKVSPENVYLIMEYCNGGDLGDYLEKNGALSEDTIRIFLRQIASAMTVLHAKEIMHRDLKPQNLLLSYKTSNPTPQNITIKLADFGLARYLQGNNLAGTFCGSPLYVAPEVISEHLYDAKADLWSIGVIVFECLTGDIPFSPEQLVDMAKNNVILVPKIPTQTSRDLTSLLAGLLKQDPKERIEFPDMFTHPFLAMTVESTESYKEIVWESISTTHHTWFPYKPSLCQNIEKAYQKYLANPSSSPAEVTSRNHCSINFKNMEQINNKSKGVSPVRRLVFQPSYAAAKQIGWQWNSHETTSLQWSSYPTDVAEYMEQNFQENPKVPLDLSTHFPDLNYTVDFAAKRQTNNSTKFQRPIKRVVLPDKYPVERDSKRQVFTFVQR